MKSEKVTQKTIIVATLATLTIWTVGAFLAANYLEWSLSYGSNMGSSAGSTGIGEVIGKALENILIALLAGLILVSLLVGTFLRRVLHTRNGFLTVLLAEFVLLIIAQLVNSVSQTLGDFIFNNFILRLSLIFLYLYLFYFITLRKAPSQIDSKPKLSN